MTAVNGRVDTSGTIVPDRSDGVRRAGTGGAEPLPHNFPQPPPPPPAPRKPSLAKRAMRAGAGLTDQVAAHPARFKLISGLIVVLGVNIVITRWSMPDRVDEEAIANRAARLALNEVGVELDTARNQQTQIAVAMPFSWAKCPLSTEAKVMIGGDPQTGGKTINPDRAAPLEQQATALLTQFRMVDLRLVAASQSQLRIVADNPSAGVALFACNVDSAEPAPAPTTTVVATPQDPTPPATVVQQ